MARVYTQKDATDAIRAHDTRFQPREDIFPAMLGDGNGVVIVPDRGSKKWNYARPRGTGGGPMVVYNGIAPCRNNWPVLVTKDPTQPDQYVVIRTQTLVPGTDVFGDNATVYHHEQHTFGSVDSDGNAIGGDDTVFARLRQMADGRVAPTDPASMTVAIVDSIYDWGGTIEYYSGGSLDLTAYVPADGAVWVLISLAADAVIDIVVSGVTYAPAFSQIPSPADERDWRLAAVLLIAGQTAVTDWPEPDQSIFDLRFVSSVTSSVYSNTVRYLDDLLDVNVPAPLDGQVLTYDAATTAWDAEYLLYSFLSLIDTPGSYLDQGSRVVAVRSDETGLQFITISAGGGGNPMIFADGTLVVATEIGAYIVTAESEIDSVYVYCKDSGSVGTTIVDVHLNGMTIFTTQANRPQLVWNDVDKIAKSGTPDVTDLVENDILTVDVDQVATGVGSLTVIIAMAGGGGGGSTTFSGLTDTPDTYVGQAGKRVVVKGDVTGLEFEANTLLNLDDTPGAYTGHSLKTVRVNAGETAVEFAAAGGASSDAEYVVAAAHVSLSAEIVNPGVAAHADVVPSSPDAKDDEFDSASLDVKWTTLNVGNRTSYDVDTTFPSHYYAVHRDEPAAADYISGIYESLSGDFDIAAKINLGGIHTNYLVAGVGVSESPPGKITFIAMNFALHQIFVYYFNTPTSWNSNRASVSDMLMNMLYFRIRLDSGTIYYYYSVDGKLWMQIWSEAWSFFTVAAMGLFVNNNNTGGDLYLSCDWIRKLA